MEFYQIQRARAIDRIRLFQFPTGWNSTETRPQSRIYPHPVSIPNGMEFYAQKGKTFFYPERFNSQRDGILLSKKAWQSTIFLVSIPNGMEFYRVSEP